MARHSISAVRGALCALLFGSTLSLAAAPVSPYSNLFILGDSISDSGNVKNVYDAAVAANGGTPPAGLGPRIPPDIYYNHGQGTFSNGPSYAEVLGNRLGIGVMPSVLGGNNYAFAGARTDYQIFQFASPAFLGLTQQRDKLLADHPGGLDPDALYVVFGGGNNVQDILRGGRSAGNEALGAPSTVQETILDISGVVNDIFAHGGQHLLLANLPNVGLVPRVQELGAAAIGAGLFLSSQINLGIDTIIAGHLAAGRDVMKLDVFGLLNGVIANAAALGFTNTNGRCYGGDDLTFLTVSEPCGNPDEYVFWDGIHPTARVHDILGNAAFAVVAVPEPETWALFVAGLGCLVIAARRKIAA